MLETVLTDFGKKAGRFALRPLGMLLLAGIALGLTLVLVPGYRFVSVDPRDTFAQIGADALLVGIGLFITGTVSTLFLVRVGDEP